MTEKYDQRIADLERRVSGMIFIGKVASLDEEKGRFRIQHGDLESDWLPMASPRAGSTKTYSHFSEGEQVIAVSPSGDMSQAVIMSAVSTEETQASDKANIHKTVYPDGTTVEYDHEAKSMKTTIADGGSFESTIGGGVSLKATGSTLEITTPGNISLNASGGIALTSATLTHNGKDISDQHKHTDVMSGPALTGPPA